MTSDYVTEFFLKIAQHLPFPLCWSDPAGRLLNANQEWVAAMGAAHLEQLAGKQPHEYLPGALADSFADQIGLAIKTGAVQKKEETVQSKAGKTWRGSVLRVPLNDPVEGVVGVLSLFVDSGLADLERLKSEHAHLESTGLENMTSFAKKISNHLGSPLAVLKLASDAINTLPQPERNNISKAVEMLEELANYLNDSVQTKTSNEETVQPEALLLSALLHQILKETSHAYQLSPVSFQIAIADSAQLAFVNLNAAELRRVLAILIKKAAQGLASRKNPCVTFRLSARADNVTLSVHDNGRGMNFAMLDRMLNRDNYSGEHGGDPDTDMKQVWSFLEQNKGVLDVETILGEGTAILLTFPRVTPPDWIAADINLTENSIVVILDADREKHKLWHKRLDIYQIAYPDLQLHYFIDGQKALELLGDLSPAEQGHTVLLTEYALPDMAQNGLELIAEARVGKAILVTDQISDAAIQQAADGLKVKILPPHMISFVPINFTDAGTK